VQEASRFVVVHASALAQQETTAAATAHAKEAERVAAPIKHGGCFRVVDLMLDGAPKLIPINEQPNHQIMHVLRF
jgi:hypothetical protein